MKTKNLVFDRNDNQVDLHIDAEFVDNGDAGLFFISIGIVIASNKSVSTFYGLSHEFFNSKVFRNQIGSKTDKNRKFMMENVYNGINGVVHLPDGRHYEGDIASLADHINMPGSVVALTTDQTYTIIDDAGKQRPELEPDVVVVGTNDVIASQLLSAVRDAYAGSKKNAKDLSVRVFGYYPSHDTVVLDNLFGGMLHVPDFFQYYTYDLRGLGDVFGYNHDDLNPRGNHNALSDAWAQYVTTQELRKKLIQDHTGLVERPEASW